MPPRTPPKKPSRSRRPRRGKGGRRKPGPKPGAGDAFVASMELVCDLLSNPPVPVPAEFYDRWTLPIKESWAQIVIGPNPGPNSDQEHVASRLNGVIDAQYAMRAKTDLGLPAVPLLGGFVETSWTPGGGGLHRGVATVMARYLGVDRAWSFVDADNRRHQMSATVTWRKEVVIP